MNKFLLKILMFDFSKDVYNANKMKKNEKIIEQENHLKNLINKHIHDYHLIENTEFDSQEDYIKLACNDLKKICNIMKSMNIHAENIDVANKIRNYNRFNEQKIKNVLNHKRLNIENNKNVLFLLKNNNLRKDNNKLLLNDIDINFKNNIVLSKNKYKINLLNVTFGFVKSKLDENFLIINSGKIVKTINDYQNKEFEDIPIQNIDLYTDYIEFTVTSQFKELSFILDNTLNTGYKKINFSSLKVI